MMGPRGGEPGRLEETAGEPVDSERDVAGQPAAQSRSGPSGVDASPLSTDMQSFIGRQLRAVYDDIAKQPVPDRFLELMKQLEGKTSGG